jgi:excisionase family DNA binding protein
VAEGQSGTQKAESGNGAGGLQDHGTAECGTAVEAFISKAEVARRLGKNERTVELWVRKGIIPQYKVNGRSVLFKWSEIERVLTKCRGKAGSGGQGAES